ncbi:MAG: class I SAM-dependent methyltransferase [Cyclobacteriaceae bacterium]
MHTSVTLELVHLISILLGLVFLFLLFKILESKWSYRISKPHMWEEGVKQKTIPSGLLSLERTYRDKVRFYTFWLQIKRLEKEKVEGDFAELGVYEGETAKIIHQSAPSRALHLFDTFEGFSQKDLSVEKSNEKKYNSSNFSDITLEEVKENVSGNENIHFHKGYFLESTEGLEDKNYAFIHLDADLYMPTLEGLKYFYPRLAVGGVIIIHDYNHTWDGATKAVDEFLRSIPETIVEIADWQGSAMIVKNED